GHHHARAGQSHGPRPPWVFVVYPDADLVEQERAARPVGNGRDGRTVVGAHHRPLRHALVGRVVDRVVPPDVVVDGGSSTVTGVVSPGPAGLLEPAVRVGEWRGAGPAVRRAD